MFNLHGKVALVTGVCGDLCRSMAGALSEAGAYVIGTDKLKMEDIDKELMVKIAEYKVMDVSNLENIQSVVSSIERIDILVNGAGLNIRGSILDLTEDDWDKVLGVNLKGPFLVAKVVAEKMLQQGNGKIINIGSLTSTLGFANMAPYVASRGGIAQLTKALATELAPAITVNAIAPGYYNTKQTRVLFNNSEWYKKSIERVPLKRFGEPEDLNGTVVYLSSDASNYVTGQIIYVDGGWIAN